MCDRCRGRGVVSVNPQLWSWILTAIGVCSLYLADRRSPWGWAVGIGAQMLWLVLSASSGPDWTRVWVPASSGGFH